MTRNLAILFLALAAAALPQEAKPAPAEGKAVTEAKPTAEASPAPADTKPETPADETPAAEGTAAAPESMIRGSVEVGYRFVGDIGGNQDVYRSVVNLGEGPRLLNLDLSLTPSLKWIDDLTIRANNWGGDPYNTTYIRAGKSEKWRLEADYRNIAYFNSLPSFANPRLETGLLASQRAYDMTRRSTDVQFELLPGNWITPFVGFQHNSGFGRGVTLYVPGVNEFPVPTELDDRTDTWRGGVRIEKSRFHVTLEVGAFSFNDNQRLYENTLNTGNRTAPFLGQQLSLRSLNAAYDINGDALFTRAALTANPTTWLDVFANWVWTGPKITTNYSESAAGTLVQGFTNIVPTQALLFDAVAKQPHNRAHAGFEVRPTSRLRIIQSIYTDRMHTASTFDRLEMTYNQNQIEALIDLTDRLSVRGGHRYTWGESRNRAPELAGIIGLESGDLRRSTALAGLSYRLAQRFTASVDSEYARSDSAYFRTSLRNYERIRARLRYQAMQNLSFAWSGAWLNNDNPNVWTRPQLGDYDLKTLDNSISFTWTPRGGSKFRAFGEYARLTWRSDILYLAPQDLRPERSLYTENGHAGSLMFDFVPSRGKSFAPRFAAGGSFFRSSGSRPSRYWQPVARASFPLASRAEFIGEWRFWGLTQPYYQFEHFRNNQATLSLRIWQ